MDNEEKIKDLYTKHHTSGEKFDYFVCTVAGGLFAYLGQQFTPEKVSRPSATTTFFALGCLAFSFYIGCRKIQIQNYVTRLNQRLTESESDVQKAAKILAEHKHHKSSGLKMELRDDLGRPQTIEGIENLHKNQFEEMTRLTSLLNGNLDLVQKFGKIRDKFLIGGFFFIVIAKILQWIG